MLVKIKYKLNSRIQILEGVIDANYFLFFAAIACLLLYIYTWYSDCYRKGYKIDFWHYSLFLPYVITMHIMYPFSGSILNDITTGGRMIYISEYIDQAYLYCLLGYILTYCGYFFAKSKNKYNIVISKLLIQVNSTGGDMIEKVLDSKVIVRLMSILLFFTTAIFFLYSFIKFGMAYNYRDLLLADQNMTTLFNSWNSIFSALGVFIIIGFFQKKDKFLIYILILVLFLAFFTGSRGTIFFTLFGGVIIYLIGLKKKLSLKYLTVLIVGSFIALSYMGTLRSGKEYESNSEFFLFSLLFGNNFSDLRDFAWILSYWDKAFLYGKSYLAALISFIPSSLIEFRQHYNIAAYTNDFLGFDSRLHPGLRPVIFGESYLNFGILGVMTIGFWGGYITKFVDLQIKESFNKNPTNYVKAYSKTFLHIVLLRFYITGGFWLLYFYIFLLIFFNIIRKSLTKKNDFIKE